MNLKNKILILMIMIFAICMIIVPNNVNAALQANGNTSKTDTLGSWIVNIRKMEATGGTLGLTDTINTTSLVSSATTSNNLDIHMEKTTEYGAMAILSASSYGNQNVIASGDTTTGNKTGVYINLNNEWTAAGSALGRCAQFVNANSKYKNVYSSNYSAKAGDAIGETTIGSVLGDYNYPRATWHTSATKSVWLGYSDYSGLLRAFSESIFSYYGYGYNINANRYPATYSNPWSSRAVIVIGEGF